MMEFHQEKCEVIMHTTVLPGNSVLFIPIAWSSTTTCRHVGVHISRDLRWDKLTDYITSKENSNWILGFVRHNISNPRVKECAYKTLVRPEYSQPVWGPYTSGAVAKIEAVQRRAAR